MRHMLLAAVLGFSVVASASTMNGDKQDIQGNFGEFMGEYEVVECKELTLFPGNVWKDKMCGYAKVEIYMSHGFQKIEPYDSFSIAYTKAGQSRSEASKQLGYIDMNEGQLCYTAPGYQYCDEPVSRPNRAGETGVDHFLTETQIVRLDAETIELTDRLNIPNRGGDYLHRESRVKLKKRKQQ